MAPAVAVVVALVTTPLALARLVLASAVELVAVVVHLVVPAVLVVQMVARAVMLLRPVFPELGAALATLAGRHITVDRLAAPVLVDS